MATFYGIYTDVGPVGGDTGVLVTSTIPGASAVTYNVKLHKQGYPPWTGSIVSDSGGYGDLVFPAPLAYPQLLEVTTTPNVTTAVSLIGWASPQTNVTPLPPEAKTKGSLFYVPSFSFSNQLYIGNPSASTTANVTVTGPGGTVTTLSAPAKCVTKYNLASYSIALKITSTMPIVLATGIMDSCGLTMILPS